MAGFSCRGRRSGLFALSFLCHAWPAYESLPVNVPSLLPPRPYNTILLFCSMVLSGHRVQGVSWVSPVQVRDWTPFEAYLIDQVLMKMIRPPLWRFLYYRLLANDVHLVVHSSTETRYRAFRDYRPEQRLHAGPIRQTDGRYLQMIELGNYLAYAGSTVGTWNI